MVKNFVDHGKDLKNFKAPKMPNSYTGVQLEEFKEQKKILLSVVGVLLSIEEFKTMYCNYNTCIFCLYFVYVRIIISGLHNLSGVHELNDNTTTNTKGSVEL